GMYNGHFGAGYEYPALIASWKNTGKDVAICVQGGDEKTIKASLYNFGTAKQIAMRTWQLQPGEYNLRMKVDQDHAQDHYLLDTIVKLNERVNDIGLPLPTNKLVTVSMSQVKSYKITKTAKTDLSLAERDIQVHKNANEEIEIQAVIHNTGNLSADKCMVSLSINGEVKDSVLLSELEAPNDLQPRSKQVIFRMKPIDGIHDVSINVACKQPEITTLNNKVTVQVQLKEGKIIHSF
ncbi:MAG: hypothetical protein EOO01_15695, partial [Chitinophagaceae bacterium]